MAQKDVELNRVVAVVSVFADGRRQWGSGYLVRRDVVLTAWHCLVDRRTHERPVDWQIRRASDGCIAMVAGAPVAAHGDGAGGDWGLDVALITLVDPPWRDSWVLPRFARVDRTRAGELTDCVAVGFPMYQLTGTGELETAELRGTIRQADAALSRKTLVFKDSHLGPVQLPPGLTSQTSADSPFGGLSGALVFHQGWVLGHVVEHQPHRGDAILVMPVDRIAGAAGVNGRRIADALRLPPPDRLPVGTSPVSDLAGLVDLCPGGGAPCRGGANAVPLGR